LLLPNSKQWDAEEGAYVTAKLNTMEIDTSEYGFSVPVVISGTLDSQTIPVASPVISTFPFNGTTQIVAATNPIYVSDFNFCGAFFTGLSTQSSLTVNWNIFVERFPSQLNTELVVLAQPSPCYCPAVFELYKVAMGYSPPGVPVKENGLGDWFAEVVSGAADILSPVLSMVPHPAAKAIGVGLGAAGMVAKGFVKKEPPATEVQRTSVRPEMPMKQQAKKKAAPVPKNSGTKAKAKHKK